MSPKINKGGVSYDESDPRSSVPRQRGEDEGPRVTRARDFDAAQKGLRPDDEMNESSVNEDEDREEIKADPDDTRRELGGLEQVQHVEAQDNYDDKVAWPYPALQAECKNRELDGSVSVSRDELITRLREDDEKKRNDGDDTPSGVSD